MPADGVTGRTTSQPENAFSIAYSGEPVKNAFGHGRGRIPGAGSTGRQGRSGAFAGPEDEGGGDRHGARHRLAQRGQTSGDERLQLAPGAWRIYAATLSPSRVTARFGSCR